MSNSPGEVELRSFYRKHFGPRMQSAGLAIQFHYNQIPGIHFKVEPSEPDYRRYIELGLNEGMALRFPHFPETGSIWILEIQEDPVDSCAIAFYKVARLVIDQAHSLSESKQWILPSN
jgi:hypothetical protein